MDSMMTWFGSKDASSTNADDATSADRDPFLRSSKDASKNGSRSSASKPAEDRVYRERVLVRVYDLGQTFLTRGVLNQVVKSYGAFHTGVEIYGREWSFGMTFDDWSTGVTWNPPGMNPDHRFRETLSMGYTPCSPEKVREIINAMKIEWKGCTYNVLTRNCHHFSDAFCKKLGVTGIPPWINDLADTGAATIEFLDSADSGYDGGEALFDFFDSVKRGIFGGQPARQNVPRPLPAPRRDEELHRENRHDPFALNSR